MSSQRYQRVTARDEGNRGAIGKALGPSGQGKPKKSPRNDFKKDGKPTILLRDSDEQ